MSVGKGSNVAVAAGLVAVLVGGAAMVADGLGTAVSVAVGIAF